METKSKIKGSLSLKLFIIGLLVFLLMIPTGMIALSVNDRQSRQEEAIREISDKWAGSQSVVGPILSVPYKEVSESNENGNKKIEETVHYAHFLPDTLSINGQVYPEKRQRGIYEAVVYEANLDLQGNFSFPDFSKWDIKPELIMFDKAFVSLGIPDMRGIKENIAIDWNGQKNAFQPGLQTNDVLSSGANASVQLDANDRNKKYNYSFKLVLKGSSNLQFSPVSKVTEVKLSSSWPSPSFQGAFLPSKREVNENGFKAEWKVLELNRSFPQRFLGANSLGGVEQPIADHNMEYDETQTDNTGSNFGVNLLVPAGEYQQVVRALKYAIMLLSLTFLIIFFFEALQGARVHPLQYILIGLALALFYVLLLSIAEIFGFILAYWVSTIATVGLILLYSKSVFKSWKLAFIEAMIILFIYSFIFVILQLEDYSLLAGSVGLFVILSAVMFVSRKIEWYGYGGK